MAQQQQIHPFLQNTIVEIKESGKRTYSPECPRCDDIVQSHTLLYCTKGKGEVVIDGSSSKFARKSLLLLPPQIGFEFTHSSSHGIEMHALSFDLYRLSVSEDHRRVYERELSFPLHGVIEKTGSRVQYLLRQFSGQSAPRKEASRCISWMNCTSCLNWFCWRILMRTCQLRRCPMRQSNGCHLPFNTCRSITTATSP